MNPGYYDYFFPGTIGQLIGQIVLKILDVLTPDMLTPDVQGMSQLVHVNVKGQWLIAFVSIKTFFFEERLAKNHMARIQNRHLMNSKTKKNTHIQFTLKWKRRKTTNLPKCFLHHIQWT